MKKILFLTLLIMSVELFAKGSCQCPDDRDKRGSRCGRRSAFCKPGGDEPACGTKSDKERKELFMRAC